MPGIRTPPPPGLAKGQEQQLKKLIGRRVMSEPMDPDSDSSGILALA